MNKKLHFTWWHIFAFIAIIFIVYASFMGVAFKTEGNFLLSGFIAAGVVLVFVLFFLVPQQLKATEAGFSACIWIERILLTLAIPVTIAFASMPQSPFVHFSAIVQKAPLIEGKFSTTVGSFDGMFTDYEAYASQREKTLSESLRNQNLEAYEVANRKEVLHLLVMPKTYSDYKEQTVIPYIEKAKDISVWNVHTVSNLSKIRATADTIVNRLESQSGKILSYEDPAKVETFDGSQSLNAIIDKVNDLSGLFKDNHWSWLAVICAFFASFFMFIPYLAQQRNGKNPYALFSNDRFRNKRNGGAGSGQVKCDSKNDSESSSSDINIDIVM